MLGTIIYILTFIIIVATGIISAIFIIRERIRQENDINDLQIFGHLPGGTFKKELCAHLHLAGYPTFGTYVIKYTIPSGFHKLTGSRRPYKGIRTTAYLPANRAGEKLVARLNNAFKLQMTFSIEITNEDFDVLVWNIPHKALKGYPDALYLHVLKKYLDMLGVK